MGIFASKSKSKTFSERDRAILQLKTQRDEMSRKIKKYEADISRLVKTAKDLVREGRKDKALSMLRKKRYFENTVNNLDKQLEQVENMTTQLEFTQIEMQVIENLKAGNQVLDKLHKMMTLEDVEKIMEETKDGIAYQKEIDEILSRELNDEDEEEVEKEFDEMIKTQLDNLPVVGDQIEQKTNPEGIKEKQKKIAVAAS